MPIQNYNFAAVVFLSELDIQCKLITRYTEQLKQAATHWVLFEQGIDDGGKAPPIDIVAACSVCLSAVAAIRRLLFDFGRSRNNPQIGRRCAALMDLLGNPSLSYLNSPSVRNSWEHLDERLDDLLLTRTSGAIADIHVSAKPPADGTTALRRFDPVGFSIYFTDTSISLQSCVDEAALLSTCISKAFERLHSERVDVH